MNLRRLKIHKEKYSIIFDFNGHKSMAGINQDAVSIKKLILSCVEPQLDPKFMNYMKIQALIKIILNEIDIVKTYDIEMHNDVMYIRWSHRTGASLFCLRLYFNRVYSK